MLPSRSQVILPIRDTSLESVLSRMQIPGSGQPPELGPGHCISNKCPELRPPGGSARVLESPPPPRINHGSAGLTRLGSPRSGSRPLVPQELQRVVGRMTRKNTGKATFMH